MPLSAKCLSHNSMQYPLIQQSTTKSEIRYFMNNFLFFTFSVFDLTDKVAPFLGNATYINGTAHTWNICFLKYISWNLLIVLCEEMLRNFRCCHVLHQFKWKDYYKLREIYYLRVHGAANMLRAICNMSHRCAPHLTITSVIIPMFCYHWNDTSAPHTFRSQIDNHTDSLNCLTENVDSR